MARTGIAITAAITALLVLPLAACAGPQRESARPDGVWGSPGTRGEPSLEFSPSAEADAGSYSGSDGCNTLGGSYSVDSDGTIDLGEMRATLMYCAGVDTWLSLARTAKIDEGTMTLYDGHGAEIGTLGRAEGD